MEHEVHHPEGPPGLLHEPRVYEDERAVAEVPEDQETEQARRNGVAKGQHRHGDIERRNSLRATSKEDIGSGPNEGEDTSGHQRRENKPPHHPSLLGKNRYLQNRVPHPHPRSYPMELRRNQALERARGCSAANDDRPTQPEEHAVQVLEVAVVQLVRYPADQGRYPVQRENPGDTVAKYATRRGAEERPALRTAHRREDVIR